MNQLRFSLVLTIALAACSAEDESLGRKSGGVSNEAGAVACTAPNPQGCTASGCPVGQYCYQTPPAPGSADCVPSSCSCDARTGAWICTSDCGGGRCRHPDDAAPIPRGEAGRD